MNAYSNEQTSNSKSLTNANLIWAVVALVTAIFFCSVNTAALVLGASFGAKILAVIAGALLGWVGALVGNAVRKFAQPDVVMTSGGMASLIWLKLFWSVGPQLFGLVAGVVIGEAIVLS
ncbi:hypothetical protein GCM10007242_27830 [Pigmentiphaga litoralis]|uniref:hypothetical protein n=1 Tax=Pigmentiphaga litoralis TaxID=516702 RepID=UPI0019CEDC44|nr:hypothetical protein [Pigmentiphaga litoralis]GGX19404.1 hypothetical protein GCM10007242_27830 [Pigmentiphaga litoralis]